MHHKNAVYIIKDKNDAVRTAKNLLSLGANSVSIKINWEHKAFNVHFTASGSVIQEGRSGVKYTPAEETFILTRYLAGLPVGYIASRTHRKFGSIETRLRKYDIYLLDNQDHDAVDYTIFLYKLISLEKIDESDVKTYLSDIYEEVKDTFEQQELEGCNYNSWHNCVMESSALNLKPVLARALKVCKGFDAELCVFALEQFEESGNIKSKLAFLRHHRRDDEYFSLLDKVDLGIPLNWTIDLLRNKLAYEETKHLYPAAMDVWNTVANIGLSVPTRDQRDMLRTAVTHSEAWQLNIDRVHSLANSGNTLASWFLGKILLSGVSRSPDQSINQLSDIVISCLSGSLLHNKKAYDYITKNVLAFPEQNTDRYLDKLLKTHQQLQNELDEDEQCELIDDELIESAESIIEREKAQEDWGESFDDLDPSYWASYLGGPDDDAWESTLDDDKY